MTCKLVKSSEDLEEAAMKEAYKRYKDLPALNIGGDYEFSEYHGEERELFVEGAQWGAQWQKKQISKHLDKSPELEYLATSLEETIGTSPHSRETIISYLQQAAQWQKDQDVNKAREWLRQNILKYFDDAGVDIYTFLDNFITAMEDEQ